MCCTSTKASANQTLEMVAYARTGDSYKEVARVEHGYLDGQLALAATGVATIGQPDTPFMPYVDMHGQPSGATMDDDRLSLSPPRDSSQIYTVQRADRTWTVNYEFPPDAGLPTSETACVLCATAQLGPGDTTVLVVKSPTADGDLQNKLSLLSDQVTTYDTDWDYLGVLGGEMLFDRLDQDSITFGTVDV